SVAPKYDLMNDLMSMGLHRLWKMLTLFIAHLQPDDKILELAGGTADLALRMARTIQTSGQIFLGDINAAMLQVGRDKLIDAG
ncbi:class I SAM-dependent methyltransferase, partial [Acinetobacter baumannii]